MIKAKDGEVTLRGKRSHVMAEAVTVLRALKEAVSEEEYKMVIRLADKQTANELFAVQVFNEV